MQSMQNHVVFRVLLYSCFFLVLAFFITSYLIQRKSEDSIVGTIDFIRDTKFKSLNKDNLQTAYEFSNLNYVSYILDGEGNMLTQSRYRVAPEIKTLCKETESATSTRMVVDYQVKYFSLKKNGQMCLVIESNTNTSAMLGMYTRNIFYILLGVYFVIMFLILRRSYKKIINPTKQISLNTENALVSKWESITPAKTKIAELQELDKFSNYLIDLLRQRSTGQASEKIFEIKNFHNKSLNQKLEQDANKFKLAVDSAIDAIAIVDKFGYINYINKTVTTLTGFRIEDAENKRISDLWHKDDDLNIWKTNYETVAKTKQPAQFVSIGYKKGDLKFEAQVQISPIKNADDTVSNFLVIERDVTEEKQKERIKTEFISVVSHELRTPMTVIRGYSTLLAEGKLGELNEKQKEYVNKINEETGQLLELANDMLDIQKFESGKIMLKFEKSKISDFVKKIVDEHTEMFAKKNLKLYFENNLTQENASIDLKYFARVLTNLLSNAYKYTEKGEIKVFLINPDEHHIVLAVKDTGVGIKEEALNHLFERFYQADGVMQRKQEGSGLGLSIVKKVVEAHNGMVWVESEVGVGSTFYVAIPVA